MPLDLPPKIWMPQKPAIIRAAPDDLKLIRRARQEHGKAVFPLMPMPMPAASPLPVLTFTDQIADGTDATTYQDGNWDAVDISTASATRRIIFSINWRASAARTISSLTVGGVSCTQAASSVNAENASEVWISGLVASGTTADVILTFNNTVLRVGVAVWAVYDLLSATPTDTATSVASPGALTIDLAANGVAVGGAFSQTTSDSFAWANMTERVTTSTIEANGSYSAADYSATAAETNRAVTVTYGTGLTRAAAAAAFR